MVHKFIVLHNIKLVLIANVGNPRDKAFLIGTNSTQNFTL
ncbi:hypothetical protein SPAB_01484 [Salmonella enterica subsp. enterica serovar Paratyphi B str. SPB7]|uniref:Uncharacterized protein n=1 Tax=Salmonella paratyphi B (strain ATCC BAA-1250 / SPB7) TaxID=1016998 RepID=A0A6C6YZZ3_SALPB|nr:hypothetical protein SPAB_01484 [Salmonella enterica subsp. enterica serovar Paratyphi B str. SPB7]